jgi:hypothetical protein
MVAAAAGGARVCQMSRALARMDARLAGRSESAPGTSRPLCSAAGAPARPTLGPEPEKTEIFQKPLGD